MHATGEHTMLGSQHTNDTSFLVTICSFMGFHVICSVCLLISYIRP
jgi:hypothetical protein